MLRLLDQRIRNVFTYHVFLDLRTKIALNQVSRVLQRNDLKIQRVVRKSGITGFYRFI